MNLHTGAKVNLIEPRLIGHASYAQFLRPLLPPEAFRRRPSQIWYAAANLGLILSACILLRRSNRWYYHPLAAIVVGHSFACLAFFAHELSHGALLKRGAWRSIVEEITLAFNLIPMTVWKVVHNQTHHLETNTVLDPDRRFGGQERDIPKTLYSVALYPSRETLRWNPLVFIQFLGYILRQITGALGGTDQRLLPSSPAYSRKQRIAVGAEIMLILSLQAALYWLVGFNSIKYLFVGPLALVVTSAVVMTYVFTNHFLNPIHDESDPLLASTSVIVPRWVDLLHCHFSYHTEHHVFPALASTYYPRLSELLSEHYPDRYHRIRLSIAWSRLWDSNLFTVLPPCSTSNMIGPPIEKVG